MRGVFRIGIALSAVALLVCGLVVSMAYAAFTTHDKGVASVTISEVGETTFTITSTDKYYPGYKDGILNVSLKYGNTGDMAVKITDLTIDSIDVSYAWFEQNDATNVDYVTLTIKPKSGSWSSGTGKAGWYASGTEYIYYTNSASTQWRCKLNNNVPTFYYNTSVTGGTTLPTFTCNVSVKEPPTAEIENSTIDGTGLTAITAKYMLDGCDGVIFKFSMLASQV